jgi:uncharacterized protein
MKQKLEKLKGILREMGSVLIAYSGGSDSSFLLKVAKDTLGEKVAAATAFSPTYPEEEAKEAKKIAKELGAKHIFVQTEELEDPNFVSNSPRRCYYCKKKLFSSLKELAREKGLRQVVDGSNFDDTGDFRPGMEAARELEIRSPLKEAGLGKAEIRCLSREMGLATWNKPSLACLSSRFPYGIRINRKDLVRVDKAERFLKSLGICQVRVRHYAETARVEVLPTEMK